MDKEDIKYLILISGLTFVYAISLSDWIRKSMKDKKRKEEEFNNCPVDN